MMKIDSNNNYNKINFCGKYKLFFPENPKGKDFIKNVVLNSAITTMQNDKTVCFLPCGSWVTGINYNPKFSDRDLKLLFPNMPSYSAMEAKAFEMVQVTKENMTKKFERHNISEKAIYGEILPSINIFPPHMIQKQFDSYEKFHNLTNLKLSLHPSLDNDKGLWQQSENFLGKYFDKEGYFLYLKKDGSVGFFPIAEHKQFFTTQMKKRNISMPDANVPLYESSKLKAINEFILDIIESPNERLHFKYLHRLKKILPMEAKNDLFLMQHDISKKDKVKFQPYIFIEKQFSDLKENMMGILQPIESFKASIPLTYIKRIWPSLNNFVEVSQDMLSRTILTGFEKP